MKICKERSSQKRVKIGANKTPDSPLKKDN